MRGGPRDGPAPNNRIHQVAAPEGCPVRRDRDASFTTGVGSGDVGSPTEDAELVAFGVGQHNPALFDLTNVDSSRAERLESGDFLVPVAADRAYVEVHSVLYRLAFGDGDEHEEHVRKRRAGL
jgi:hypothetical protein